MVNEKSDAYGRVKEIVNDMNYEVEMYQKALELNPEMKGFSTCGIDRSKPRGLALLTNAIVCCS
jgi:hypothetical protein